MRSTKAIPPLLTCQALQNLLRAPPSPKISLLEADIGKQFYPDFKRAHIPQARYFDQLECTTPTKLIARGIPDVKCFESYLSRLGVSNDDHIVLYDRSPVGFYASTRAWWLLRTYGINRLSILNGGFQKWLKEGNQTEASNESDVQTGKTGQFTVHFNKEMIKDYKQMLSIVSNKSETEQIVDSRPPEQFYGSNDGHMPNTVNIPYADVLDETNQCLKSKDELQKMFDNAGVDRSKRIIYSCRSGTTASTLAFVGYTLGQDNPPVYNGSFAEWQQRAPKEFIVTGTATAA